VQLAAESVTTILQSKRSDDDISAELAELLGFEDVELVTELIHNRSQLVEYLVVRLLIFIMTCIF
jgi:antiviral helicase SLH1